MVHIKLFEAFESGRLSGVLKYINSEYSKDQFFKDLNFMLEEVLDFPLSRITDQDIQYLNLRKAAALKSPNPKVSNPSMSITKFQDFLGRITGDNLRWIKFWFDKSGKYLGHTVCTDDMIVANPRFLAENPFFPFIQQDRLKYIWDFSYRGYDYDPCEIFQRADFGLVIDVDKLRSKNLKLSQIRSQRKLPKPEVYPFGPIPQKIASKVNFDGGANELKSIVFKCIYGKWMGIPVLFGRTKLSDSRWIHKIVDHLGDKPSQSLDKWGDVFKDYDFFGGDWDDPVIDHSQEETERNRKSLMNDIALGVYLGNEMGIKVANLDNRLTGVSKENFDLCKNIFDVIYKKFLERRFETIGDLSSLVSSLYRLATKLNRKFPSEFPTLRNIAYQLFMDDFSELFDTLSSTDPEDLEKILDSLESDDTTTN